MHGNRQTSPRDNVLAGTENNQIQTIELQISWL